MVRRRWTRLSLLIGLLALSLLAAPSAHACSCYPYSFEEAAGGADLIADITILDGSEDRDGMVTYSAVVDTVWKGEESRTIRFRSHAQAATCGLGPLEDGTSLLVWAYGEDGEYASSWCTQPTDRGPDDRDRLTELLGEPTDLTDQPVPQEAGTIPRPLLWIPVALAVTAVLILRGTAAVSVLMLHRRRRR